MSSTPARPPVLPAAWTNVLEQITSGLERAIALTAEREQAIQADALSEASAGDEAICRSLAEQRQAWLNGLDAFVRRAEHNATETAAVLEAEVGAAQRWLKKTAELRRKLAERTTPSV